MRKTIAQLVLFIAFLFIAWISLQTIWKTRAPIPEGYITPVNIGDYVKLNRKPNPKYEVMPGFNTIYSCLDVINGVPSRKGARGKVLNKVTEKNINYVILTCDTPGAMGIYKESEIIPYNQADPVTYPKSTRKLTPTCTPSASEVFGIKRADQCRCLPGYIPFKTDCGTYTCQNTTDATVIRNCY